MERSHEDLHDHRRDENEHAVLENKRNWLKQLLQSFIREGAELVLKLMNKVSIFQGGFITEAKKREEWLRGCYTGTHSWF